MRARFEGRKISCARRQCLHASWFRAAALLLASVPGSVSASDPLPYTVTLKPTGNGALDAALSGSLQLNALRTRAPAGPFAVVARARADLPRLTAALESFGYYRSHVAMMIAGLPLDDPSLPATLDERPKDKPAPVLITLERGPLYRLRHVGLDGTVPAAAARAFTLRPGAPAVATDVLGAGGAMLAALHESGYAFASIPPPEAVEIPAEHALDVTYHVTPGPRVDIGPITIAGLRRVHERYVRRRLLLKPGQRYRPGAIETARQDLLAAGVFSGVVIRTAPAPDAAGALPITFDVAERPRHAVTANVAFSTDLGGSAGVTWSHRNFFGNAEQLNLGVSITGLGGSAVNGVGYDATAQLIKPDFLRRDQSLQFDLAALKQSLDAYDQTAAAAGVTLSRKLSPHWTASVGVALEREKITQEDAVHDYTLFGIPITGHYDSTGIANPLDDARHGVRAQLSATPTESLGRGSVGFVVLQAAASSYFDLARLGLGPAGSSVLAVRALVGSAQGAGSFDLPPDQRFYGGGSATVRGFKYQSVGPLFPDGNPVGGAAIDAATIEFRQRVWGGIGAALFADAGQVSPSSGPFQGTLREGIGTGLRYYTPIGPIRVDVAVPLNRPPGGDGFELYLGLGQAF